MLRSPLSKNTLIRQRGLPGSPTTNSGPLSKLWLGRPATLPKLKSLLTTAMDIAAATGKPLQTVVDAIAKAAQNGSTGGLARLGLKIKDVNGEMLTLDEIMGNAQDTMGGAMSERC